MINDAPIYFSDIKEEASQRWEQLEKYPDLAAPWYQLFRQIQSPRHVISELLQNADDVGATWISVSVHDSNFTFQHNGEDFNEDNFRSLCRFGYSNKRTLHTIGFRGIGFKSTFSLGSPVMVKSPTLSVAFTKQRFTEPIWQENLKGQDDSVTSITVKIDDLKILEFLEENMQKWVENPLPLLFFHNIQTLKFGDQLISRSIEGNGPVKNSKWIKLTSKDTRRLLLVSSEEQEVPPQILDEIRDERGGVEFDAPPCRVSIILGLEKQQLYEILPTNVNLQLPFSANAPFIQDPARTGIKDPLRSPMNHWLLRRIGSVAGSAFFEWLANSKLSIKNRAQAYALLPSKEESNNLISGYCEKVILDTFQEVIKGKALLLTSQGTLETAEKCIDIDPDLFNVWQDHQLVELFGMKDNSIIASEVGLPQRKLLIQWNLLKRKTSSDILDRLIQSPSPQKPSSENLKVLWEFVNKHLVDWSSRYWKKKDLRVIPVKGKNSLFPANQVNVLGVKEKQLTDDEFAFLEDHLIILDPEWFRIIQKLQIEVKEKSQAIDKSSLAICNLYSELGLEQGVTIESIFRQVVEAIFANSDPGKKGLRIAFIACRLGLAIPDNFKYLCQDGRWRAVQFGILMHDEAILQTLYPKNFYDAHLINKKYQEEIDKNEIVKWNNWTNSEKSRLRRFLFPEKINQHISGKQQVNEFCKQRNGDPPTEYKYKSTTFYITDYDFPEELWKLWDQSAIDDPNYWTYIINRITLDWNSAWNSCDSAGVQQETTSYYHFLNHGKLSSRWIERLKKKRCIPDSYSNPRFPGELLRNTPDTSDLLRIEAFVHPKFDFPGAVAFLDLLGVRNKPTDPTKIIERIRSLSAISSSRSVVLQEIANLYDALDRVILRMSSDQVDLIKNIFKSEKLILSEELTWHFSTGIFQSNPDRIPGVPLVNSVSANLNLWNRLIITKSPSIENAIQWLNGLPSGENLTNGDKERVKTIIQRVPDKVWIESNHWISLDGKWQSCKNLTWATEKLVQGNNLYSWVKQKTADLSIIENPLQILHLGGLQRLDEVLEYRVSRYDISRNVPNPEWIRAIGRVLSKVVSQRDSGISNSVVLNSENICRNAERLAQSQFRYVKTLDVTPYIAGEPAGFHSSVKALWHDRFLYVYDDRMNSYREIVQAVATAFQDASIREAIKDCIGRDEYWIDDYFRAYFILGDPSIDPKNKITQESTSDSPDGGEDGSFIHDDNIQEGEGGDEIKEDPGENGDDNDVVEVRKKRRRTMRPEEKFSLFIQNDEFIWQIYRKVFTNKSGHFIRYSEGLFPWCEYNIDGNEVCRYRIEEGVLSEGFAIRADVLDLMKQLPDLCCLVIHEENSYRKFFRKEINQLLRENILIIQPAAYWIKQVVFCKIKTDHSGEKLT